MKNIIIIVCLFFASLFFASSAKAEIFDDLSVGNIILSPTQPVVGQLCSITVRINNTGVSAFGTGTGFDSTMYDFGNFKISRKLYPHINSSEILEPGAYVEYYYEGFFEKSEDLEIYFTIDYSNKIEEKDETNNTYKKSIKVYKPEDVDLSVAALSLSEEKPLIGKEIMITATVRNIGQASLIASSGLTTFDTEWRDLTIIRGVFYDFDDFVLTKVTNSGLPGIGKPLDPGGEIKYYFTGSFSTGGSKKMSFIANKYFSTPEGDHNNNATSSQVFVYKDEDARNEFTCTTPVVESISSTSVQISWETSQEADGFVKIWPYAYIGFMDQQADSKIKKHQLIFSNLSPGANYRYLTTASNLTINKNLGEGIFMTPASDNLSVIDLSSNFDKASGQTQIGWQTELLSKGVLHYKKSSDNDYTSVSTDNFSIKQTKKLSLGAGEYDYYVEVENKTGIKAKSGNKKLIVTASGSQTASSQTDIQTSTSTDTSKPGSQTQVIEDNSSSVSQTISSLNVKNNNLFNKLKGRVIIRVEKNGEAYYIDPQTKKLMLLGKPEQMLPVLRKTGIGINNFNLEKISFGANQITGQDTDGDGLSDIFETAIGTNPQSKDTDNDSFSDKEEITYDYSPLIKNKKINTDRNFAKSQAGRIFIQVENKGQAWYISPIDYKRYYLGSNPSQIFSFIKKIGQGISEKDFNILVN